MENIRAFFLEKIKEPHLVNKIIKEYVEDTGQVEMDGVLKKYYLTEMNFLEYLAEAKIVKAKYEKKNQVFGYNLKYR